MLRILGLTNNHSNDYFKKLKSTRNKNSSTKAVKASIPSYKKEFSKYANDNTAKKKSRNKTNKNSEKKNVNMNSYKYIQQKASFYNKASCVNNINNLLNKDSNQKGHINVISSICLNKNKKITNKRKSIDDRNFQLQNLTTEKKIKEIKIKSNFNMPYINLFVNKSNRNKNNDKDIQNQTTIGNNTRMSTISNIHNNKGNIFDDENYNYNMSVEKSKTLLNSMCNGIYRRKKLKIFNSSSVEKRPRKRNTIESIEISFSPRVYINKFDPFVSPQNSYLSNKEKIIQIQKKFRKFLMQKYEKIRLEKIIKGISFMNRIIKKKKFYSFMNQAKKIKNVFYVEESQIELLKALKKKNIYSMIDLKKYIVCLIKNDKLEMF